MLGGRKELPAQLAFLARSRIVGTLGRLAAHRPLGLSKQQATQMAIDVRQRYASQFEKLFCGEPCGAGELECVGQYNGDACVDKFSVPRNEPQLLHSLALDHEQEVRGVLEEWSKARAALPHPPSSWSDGVDPAALCHILFGINAHPRYGEAYVRLRCKKCHLPMPHCRDKLLFVL